MILGDCDTCLYQTEPENSEHCKDCGPGIGNWTAEACGTCRYEGYPRSANPCRDCLYNAENHPNNWESKVPETSIITECWDDYHDSRANTQRSILKAIPKLR